MIVAREKAEYYGDGAEYYGLPQPPGERRPKPRRWRRPELAGKERLALTGMVLVIFCCCVIITYYYAQVLVTGYRLNKAEQELAMLRTESNDLYARVNQLASLEYIEAVAVHRLGMVKPGDERVVVVQNVAPPAQKKTGDAASGKAEKGPATGEQHGRNPVIEAFTGMVQRLENSIRTG